MTNEKDGFVIATASNLTLTAVGQFPSERIKHLEMIQAVINRMATFSSSIKGWSVALVVGVIALAAKDGSIRYLWAAFLPIVLLWGLDGYYLHLERGFRELFEKTAAVNSTVPPFSLKRVQRGFNCWLKATLSLPLTVFYVSILITVFLMVGIFIFFPISQSGR